MDRDGYGHLLSLWAAQPPARGRAYRWLPDDREAHALQRGFRRHSWGYQRDDPAAGVSVTRWLQRLP